MMTHISTWPTCYLRSPNAQDTHFPIPGFIRYTGVTRSMQVVRDLIVGRLHWMPDDENLIANNFTHCTALGAIRRVLLTSTITAWRSAIGVDICNSC